MVRVHKNFNGSWYMSDRTDVSKLINLTLSVLVTENILLRQRSQYLTKN